MPDGRTPAKTLATALTELHSVSCSSSETTGFVLTSDASCFGSFAHGRVHLTAISRQLQYFLCYMISQMLPLPQLVRHCHHNPYNFDLIVLIYIDCSSLVLDQRTILQMNRIDVCCLE